MFDRLFQSTTALEKGLDASWLRGQVIANNIANVQTVGFKTSSVEFESLFKDALDDAGYTTETNLNNVSALADVQPVVTQNADTSMLLDGNNVDIEAENAALAKNTIYYNTLLQKLTSELEKLSVAINEGR
jgi:flagellar basal-body rod protein FlgB